jgi:hypothetical protein
MERDPIAPVQMGEKLAMNHGISRNISHCGLNCSALLEAQGLLDASAE